MKSEPSLSYFPVQKPSPACLSTLQLAHAAGDEVQRQSFAAHLQTCSTCSTRLTDEIQLRASDALNEPPVSLMAALQRAKPAKRQSFWPALAVSMAGVAAAVLFFVQTPQQTDAPMLKGATSILATVQRHGAIVMQDVDVRGLENLEPGDALRIHVVGNKRAMARIETMEDGHASELFYGEVPSDGWLPMALEVTAGAKVQVNISVCNVDDDHVCTKTSLGL